MKKAPNFKKYLLGQLNDEDELRLIEESFLTDDRFAESLSRAGHELIEDHLDGRLSTDEAKGFTTHFLAIETNKHEADLVAGLRLYAQQNCVTRPTPLKSADIRADGWRNWFAAPAFKFSFAGAALILVCLGVWKFAIYKSDVDRGLMQLELAYSTQRPVEVRISGFDYAPWSTTRGTADEKENASRERAERLLSYAAGENDNSASLAALGKYFLTERKFDRANELFDRASRTDPNNAQLLADWGASLAEMAKASGADRVKRQELFDQSLSKLDSAIKLRPQLLEPYFNRALCLQSLRQAAQAEEAWNTYLKLDGTSRWADEARRNLHLLDKSSLRDIPADEIQAGFLRAVVSNDESNAWAILSSNRELITEKYIPQSLAMALVETAPHEREPLIKALEYAGDLESRHNSDPFAAEIAAFYRKRESSDLVDLQEAQRAVKRGYKFCKDAQFKDALPEFTKAREIFEKAGNKWEANLSSYFEGYCLVNSGQANYSAETIGKVVDFADANSYKWLEATALYWLAGTQQTLRQHSKATLINRRALAIAEQIGDKYSIQRNLLDIAFGSSFLGQKNIALEYLDRALETSASETVSIRQRQRNNQTASRVWLESGLENLAVAAALESIKLSEKMGKPGDSRNFMALTLSKNMAGIAFTKSGDLTNARKFFDDALSDANAIKDSDSRRKMLAFSSVFSASLADQTNDFVRSTELYRSADQAYDSNPLPHLQYMAKKGFLHAVKKLGDTAQLDQSIPAAVQFVEDNREKITEEKEKTTFFDNGITIYDIALEREFDKGDLNASFNLSELSSSRSLIERLGDKLKTGPPSRPLSIQEIRSRMPAGVQIIKFSVLEKKILIWVVSNEKFTVTAVDVDSTVLLQKVDQYVSLLKDGPISDPDVLKKSSRELYDLLIAPIREQLNPSLDLCVIPNKYLYYVPFASLSDSADNPLLLAHNLIYSPSASVFVLSSEKAAEKVSGGAESLLAVGNPSFDRTTFDGLADLPAAETEAAKLNKYYDSTDLLINENAKKSSFLRDIPAADVIHFAGHYVVVDREPSSSYMLFAKDGDETLNSIVTNAEIDELDLSRTKLVILSACETGMEGYFDGEGMVGLTRTFLATGVPVVVASQWKVGSDATAALMERFHIHRRVDGLSTSHALRAAQLDLLNEPDGRFTNPYYWSAFAVYGGYSTY